jgi:hypothetical protein
MFTGRQGGRGFRNSTQQPTHLIHHTHLIHLLVIPWWGTPQNGCLRVLLAPDLFCAACVVDVEITLSAEQGLTLFSFPQQWIKLASSTKATSAGR